MGSLKNVAIITDSRMAKGRLFDPANGRDNALERYAVFKKLGFQSGIQVGTEDQFKDGEVDIILFHNFQAEFGQVVRCMKKNRKAHLFYISSEPPMIAPANTLSFCPACLLTKSFHGMMKL